MARRSIPAETKTAVLVAALENGANLPAIAKQYGVSLPTVYNYLKAAKAEKAEAVASLAPAVVPAVVPAV